MLHVIVRARDVVLILILMEDALRVRSYLSFMSSRYLS